MPRYQSIHKNADLTREKNEEKCSTFLALIASINSGPITTGKHILSKHERQYTVGLGMLYPIPSRNADKKH